MHASNALKPFDVKVRLQLIRGIPKWKTFFSLSQNAFCFLPKFHTHKTFCTVAFIFPNAAWISSCIFVFLDQIK